MHPRPQPVAAPSSPAEAGSGGAPAQRRPGQARAVSLVRAHWLISALLAAGLILRVLTLLAYQPALIYIDTLKYLYGAYPGSDPLGYTVVLRVILFFGNLQAVVLVQHLLGLAMAVVVYLLVVRRGAARWLGAVAAAPVLLDAYQLQMEQTIMPDVWFEALVVAGLAVLLWRPVATLPFAAAAGLVLGTSATVRQIGEVMIVPAVVFLLAAGGGWRWARIRVTLLRAVTLAVAFGVPILAYAGVSYAQSGHLRLAGGQQITGRLMESADCATLRLPADLRPLCPTPAEQANGPDWLEHSIHSPLYSAPRPPGVKRSTLISELNRAVVSQQPLRVAASVAGDWGRLFSLVRTSSRQITPLARWQFQTHYPQYPKWVTVGPGNRIIISVQRFAFGPFHARPLRAAYGGPADVSRPLAGLLRAYQFHGGYTPGPLYAVFALAGLVGSVLALSRRTGPRTRPLALACLLFTIAAAAVLLSPDVYEFSWRYELPAVITLVPAGVFGIAAVLADWDERRRPAQRRAGATDAAPPAEAAPAPDTGEAAGTA